MKCGILENPNEKSQKLFSSPDFPEEAQKYLDYLTKCIQTWADESRGYNSIYKKLLKNYLKRMKKSSRKIKIAESGVMDIVLGAKKKVKEEKSGGI